MWDLATIIRINNEAQNAFKKKNAHEAYQRHEAQRVQDIFEQEVAIFDGASFVRSVYDGARDRRASQGETGEELS
jgi:hypothetical protein